VRGRHAPNRGLLRRRRSAHVDPPGRHPRRLGGHGALRVSFSYREVRQLWRLGA
jgi:hypothetical protein